MHAIVLFPLLAALARARPAPAPQLGDFADFVPAVKGNIPFGIASSDRKSPGKGQANIPRQERFATGTTADATPDGRRGVILEDDLISPTTPGAKIVKRRHGPYSLRPGMFDWFAAEKLPCEKCFVTAMQGGLESENGTALNIQDGAWLHHTVAIELGESVDAVCRIPGVGGLPLQETQPGIARRIFASGNERTVLRVNRNSKHGLKFGTAPGIGFAVELMNASNRKLPVWFTMTYEYVDGHAAEGYKEVTPVWMDITGCGVSSAPAKEGRYQYTSPQWTSDIDGILIESAGHMHDGGNDVQLYKNGNPTPICTNKMLYGHRRPGFLPMPKDIVMSGMGAQSNEPDVHISDSGLCYNFGEIKKGDKLQITAHYDQIAHPQFSRKGVQDPIMGISMVFVGQK
jgi:hypothetical protein